MKPRPYLIQTSKFLFLTILLIGISCNSEDPAPQVISIVDETPVVETIPLITVSSSDGVAGGRIISDGGYSIVERGVTWSKNPSPEPGQNACLNGVGAGSFECNLSNFDAGVGYYYRAYAKNSKGIIGYGNSFYFFPPAPVDDIDGNTYDVVTIGGKNWMQENLKVTKYQNGDPILNITGDADWTFTTNGAYSSYENSTANIPDFGLLYNFHAVTDSRNLCPDGWHVPSRSEVENLILNLGGNYSEIGGKLKDPGIEFWQTPNPASNSSLFSARGGGYRSSFSGSFLSLKQLGGFWTTSVDSWGDPYAYQMIHFNTELDINWWYSGAGLSIRCVKD